ncbi:CCKAR [Mytilus coruscus]|uniref:CCKAR n=1 Tax=Mytilus coruscus TaxID=42192 RepID=A0A6J8AJT0_MYTCO|nr:CCKAR [Mytilus coruscus]
MDNKGLEELNNEEANQNIGGIIFVTIIMIIGIIGNLHVLFVYIFRMKPSNHRIFILSLAVLDLITCIIGMPFIIVDLRNPLTFTRISACKVLRFVNYFICISSALILTIIAIDRYRKICVPLGKQISRQKAKILIVVCIGISLVLSWPAPVLYGHSSVNTTNPNITGIRCYTDDKFKNTKYQSYFNAVLIMLVFGFLAVLVVIYCRIGRVVSKHNTFKSSVPKATSSDISKGKITVSTDLSSENKASKHSKEGKMMNNINCINNKGITVPCTDSVISANLEQNHTKKKQHGKSKQIYPATDKNQMDLEDQNQNVIQGAWRNDKVLLVAQIPLDEVFPNAYQSTIVALEDDPMITLFDISTNFLSMLLYVKSKPEVQDVFLQTFCYIFKDDANI